MAQIYNALTRANLSNALTRALGDTRAKGGLERYGETLTPGIDLWSRPEWALLRDEILFAAVASTPAGGAGTFAKLGIRNSPDTGVLAVVTHHVITGNVLTTSVTLELEDGVLAAQAVVLPMDRRAPNSRGPVVQGESTVGAALAGLVTVWVLPNENVVIEWPVILPPGKGFRWRANVANDSLSASFRGYYRWALPGELV